MSIKPVEVTADTQSSVDEQPTEAVAATPSGTDTQPAEVIAETPSSTEAQPTEVIAENLSTSDLVGLLLSQLDLSEEEIASFLGTMQNYGINVTA